MSQVWDALSEWYGADGAIGREVSTRGGYFVYGMSVAVIIGNRAQYL